MITSILLLFFLLYIFGQPLLRILNVKPSSKLEKVVLLGGLGLILTYPAGLLNVFYEGQSAVAIFGSHLPGALIALTAIYFITLLLSLRKKSFQISSGTPLLFLFPLLLSLFLTFYKLGVPDLNVDEYDLGYQAYNLVDGIFAGRKANVISFSAHPPLPMFNSHFVMNIINPNGLDKLEDWMFRLTPAILGIYTVALTWLLALELSKSKWVALVSACLLAVNNYHLFLSRIFQREVFLTFFVILSIYCFIRYKNSNDKSFFLLSAIFSGASLLTKAVAMIWLATASIFLLPKVKKVVLYILISGIIFLPVIVYNIGAYITTGHMDIFFGAIFHAKIHPGASPIISNPNWNIGQIIKLFSDQYSLPIFLIFVLSTVLSLKNKQVYPLLVYLFFGLLLFTLVGLRVYYLEIFTPVFVVLTAMILRKAIFANLMVVFIFVYSMLYSGHTLYDLSFTTKKDYTSAFPEASLARSYSITTRSFLEDKGWKKIKTKIDKKYTSSHCLSWNNDVTEIPLRRYLGIEDGIKKHYLGKNYQREYITCKEKPINKKINLHYDSSGRISI